MCDADPTEEPDRAKQVLAQAYEWARSTGYLPGSHAMLSLARAERAYQQARTQDPRRGTGHDGPDDDPVAADRVIDLTGGGPTGQGPTVRGPAGEGSSRPGRTDRPCP